MPRSSRASSSGAVSAPRADASSATKRFFVSTCRKTSASRSTNTSGVAPRKRIPATRRCRCRSPATWSAPSSTSRRSSYGWQTDADPSTNPRVAFLFGLLQRGFVRFPREHLEQALSNVVIDLLPGPRAEWVHAFFDAFVLKPEARDQIDVLSLELPPIAWITPGGHCYFDFVLFDDFIRTLLTSAREWYATAHGDRFNLLLKTMIEAGAPEAVVVGAKREIVTAAEEAAVPDLLVRSGRVLYVVECKAFSKSRAFWRGDLDALYQRTGRIAAAVKQAEHAAALVRQALHDGTLDLAGVEEVQWAVCGPTQEFLLPPDRYGFLAAGVPRVCTHEEFLSVLEHGSSVA